MIIVAALGFGLFFSLLWLIVSFAFLRDAPTAHHERLLCALIFVAILASTVTQAVALCSYLYNYVQ